MKTTRRDPLHEEAVQSALRRRSREAEPTTSVDSERGRFALSWLADQQGVATLEMWACHLAAWAEDKPLAAVDEERVRHYYCWLYFSFVPGLEAAGLLSVDDETVTAQADEHSLDAYLNRLD